MNWEDLKYWQSGEWQVVQEKLHDLEETGKWFNPTYEDLFKALKLTPFDEVKVCFLGQDPYPDSEYATGLAFDVPGDKIPDSLNTIFDEYVQDLHYERPITGNLEKWAREGVLLWNVIPSCAIWHSMSHNWDEWKYLTKEILETLSQETTCIFVSFGSVPRKYCEAYINEEDSDIIYLSHPSKRGQMNGKAPFKGSRLFSTLNSKLVERGKTPIDWRLRW